MERGNTSVRLENPAAPPAPDSPVSSSYGLKSGSLSPGETLAKSVSTIGVLLVALNVNQFARISPSPGSLYTYSADHMHPRWGVLAGWALVIAYVGTAAAVSAAVANYTDVILRDRFGVQSFPLLLIARGMVFACYLA